MAVWNPYASACLKRLEPGLLAHRPQRFNPLRRQIDGLSRKILSQTLKGLERDGLVSRRAIPTVPVTVEYRLTPLGQTLTATLDALRVRAGTHSRRCWRPKSGTSLARPPAPSPRRKS